MPRAPDDWVHLPPGERIDELGDFLEWLAIAKPEDKQKIREEINRYWAGDVHALSTLNAMLSRVLEPTTTRDDRQQILDLIEHYSRYDPADTTHFYDQLFDLFTLLGAGLSLEPRARPPAAEKPALSEAERPVEGPTAAVEQPLAEADAAAWKLGWAARGHYFENDFGQTLHVKFPVIDAIPNGIATSIKSIDLNAATYQNAVGLTDRLVKYVQQVSEFTGARFAGNVVLPPK